MSGHGRGAKWRRRAARGGRAAALAAQERAERVPSPAREREKGGLAAARHIPSCCEHEPGAAAAGLDAAGAVAEAGAAEADAAEAGAAEAGTDWWVSWDGVDPDALIELGGGIDKIRLRLLAMDEKNGGEGLTITGMSEPRMLKPSNKIWNGSELGTEPYFNVSTYSNIRLKWGQKNVGPKVQLAMAKLLAAHELRAKGLRIPSTLLPVQNAAGQSLERADTVTPTEWQLMFRKLVEIEGPELQRADQVTNDSTTPTASPDCLSSGWPSQLRRRAHLCALAPAGEQLLDPLEAGGTSS